MEPSAWNPRYVAYAKAHGRQPEDQLAADKIDWPGGHMAGYTLWIQAQWKEFARVTGRDYPWVTCFPQEFDRWLNLRKGN